MLAVVAAITATLTILNADLAVAVAVLLLVVFGGSLLGYAPGLVAALSGFAALNYYFTPPRHSFAVDRADDLVALLVFVMIAVLVATSEARLNMLRARERDAQEQRIRGETDRSRARFLTAITHDLRTPLATIKASTGALLIPRSTLDEPGRHELLELSYGAAIRLERLVTNALEVGRIRAGELRPQRVALEAADLVRAAVERLGVPADGRTICLDINDDTPAMWVDPGMLERALANLLENALCHGGLDGGVDISAQAVPAGLEMRVADHGPGVPAADRERIFAEFIRLDDAGPVPGTGLGLAIVRALVETNGGRVWCEETPGGGATFAMVLPMVSGGER